MHTRVRAFFAIAVALAVIAVLGLAVLTEQPAYAKGPVGSSGGSSSRSDSGSGSHPSSHSSDSNHSTSSVSSSRSHDDSRSDVRRYEASSSGSSWSSRDDRYTLRTPSSRYDTRKQPTPSYRKDYADIGVLWQKRQEKRDTPSATGHWSTSDGRHGSIFDDGHDGRYDRNRDGWYYGGRDDRNRGSDAYNSRFRYHYYCYDYRPTNCYPSPYCYYYDYYPPYVYYDHVMVILRSPNARIFVEMPVFNYKSTGDYYLTSATEKSLWAALRDIQEAWQRSDIERIMDHVERRASIDVYLDGDYTYSVDDLDYYDMTRDAISVIQTRSFDFDRVSRVEDGRYIAHGTHMYIDRYGAPTSVYVTYTLERFGSHWYIVAVGTSTRPI